MIFQDFFPDKVILREKIATLWGTMTCQEIQDLILQFHQYVVKISPMIIHQAI
jgi:hypothetical protein